MARTSFSANTKAKSAEVNDNFLHTWDGQYMDDSFLAARHVPNGRISPSMLGLGATAFLSPDSPNISGTTFGQYGPNVPQVNVTIGANGMALVILSFSFNAFTAGMICYFCFSVSGGSYFIPAQTNYDNNIAAFGYTAPASGLNYRSTPAIGLITGLAAGPATFAMEQKVSSSTMSTAARRIAVIPL